MDVAIEIEIEIQRAIRSESQRDGAGETKRKGIEI